MCEINNPHLCNEVTRQLNAAALSTNSDRVRKLTMEDLHSSNKAFVEALVVLAISHALAPAMQALYNSCVRSNRGLFSSDHAPSWIIATRQSLPSAIAQCRQEGSRAAARDALGPICAPYGEDGERSDLYQAAKILTSASKPADIYKAVALAACAARISSSGNGDIVGLNNGTRIHDQLLANFSQRAVEILERSTAPKAHCCELETLRERALPVGTAVLVR